VETNSERRHKMTSYSDFGLGSVGFAALIMVTAAFVTPVAAADGPVTEIDIEMGDRLDKALDGEDEFDEPPYVEDGEVKVMLVGPDPGVEEQSSREDWVAAFEEAHEPFRSSVEALQEDFAFDIVETVPTSNHVYIEANVDEAEQVLGADDRMETPFQAAFLDFDGAIELQDGGGIGIDAGNEDSRRMANADVFYDEGYTGETIKYGHTDTGVDDSHPCFLDENGNSRVVAWDDQHQDRDDPYDNYGHGTHTLATAAGSNSAECEESGFAYDADLVVSKVLSGGGSGSFEQVEAGLQFTFEEGADVSSHSWGASPGCSSNAEQELADTVNKMADAGYQIYFSAGNSGSSGIGCPADAAKVASVGATDSDKNIASFSSRGPCTDDKICPDVSALGVNLRSALPGGGYGTYSGTSMSSPAAGGLAGLVEDASRQLLDRSLLGAGEKVPGGEQLGEDIFESRDMLRDYAEPLPSEEDSPNNDHGWGFINAEGMVEDILSRATGKAVAQVSTPLDEMNAEQENPVTVSVENVRPAIDTRGTYEYSFTGPDGEAIAEGAATANLGNGYQQNEVEFEIPFDGQTADGFEDPGTYTASVSYTYEWTSPVNGTMFEYSTSDTTSFTLIRPAVDATFDLPDPVLPGSTFDVGITFTNDGNADAQGIDVAATIPAGETVTPQPEGESLNGYEWLGDPAPHRVFVETSSGEQQLFYEPFDLAPGESTMVLYHVTAAQPGDLTHTADADWTDYADVEYGVSFEETHTVGPGAAFSTPADAGVDGPQSTVDLMPDALTTSSGLLQG